ncbi:MAG: ATP-binding protein, partial [Actinomycetota bacterium]
MREVTDLLEREDQLATLEAGRERAAEGRGGVMLISGEAGAGKTALVRAFTSRLADGHRLLWGMCDDLVIPRPLGPFRDIATEAPALAEAISGHDQGQILDAVIEELAAKPSPVVAVVEDAQWADEATVDLIGFLGRRVDRLTALIIVTYRDVGTPLDHPLRQTLGKIPTANLTRIAVGPLSRAAVAELAGTADVDDLYRLSRGNPLYVTELLRSSDGVPAPVHEAVMARLGRLTSTARACVEVAAVVPHGAEEWLLVSCGVGEGLEEAQMAGFLHRSGELFEFSHELTRRVVEDHLGARRRRECHEAVLSALSGRDEDPARLAHHAFQAGDTRAVARFSPLAARRAVAFHGHPEAREHYRQALSSPDQFPVEERATLLEEYATECLLTSHLEEAGAALERAISLREKGDVDRLGADLTLLSEVRWAQARGSEAEKAALRAVETLEERGVDPAVDEAGN